ncbi:hypothetical protein SDC9_131899 [bioreactor metagenome]|uniref:Uncharacterized protein n=1 Tax=bioreactor metagenome TaxID=1076179 RepID=A0A645D796_9ZZZZ
MLVDDNPIHQAQAGGHLEGTFFCRLQVFTLNDHGGAHGGGPRAGAHNQSALMVKRAQGAAGGSSTQNAGQAQLIAPGKKDAAGVLDDAAELRVVCLLTGIQMQNMDAAHTKRLKGLAVGLSRQARLLCGRCQHHKTLLRAEHLRSLPQNVAAVGFVLGAADDYEKSLTAHIAPSAVFCKAAEQPNSAC